MALRLHGAPAPRPDGPGDEATVAARLQARASACLSRRDIAGYAALFDQAGAVVHVHRRLQARLCLLQAGLEARPGSLAVTAAVFTAVARQGVGLLEVDAREPHVLMLTGVAFYELGDLGTAVRLFEAARRLVPELPHVDRNLQEIARRKRVRAPRPQLPAAVTVALKELGPRARRCASQAGPADGQKLSLCMIVKDEEAMLGRTLTAVAPAVDEIIVVDTGSSDRTREIAREHGARVLDVPWTGSFSDARNASFAAATGDWVMYLDADEVLVEADRDRLRALTGRVWREAFYVTLTNHTGDLGDGTAVTNDALRVFRNRPWLTWDGRIHEQIAHTLPAYLPERLERTGIRVEHFGYLGSVREAKDKGRRNLGLLERQSAEGVDTPFQHFNLGSEYAALNEAGRALEHFEHAWRMVRRDPVLLDYGYVPSLAGRYVRALRLNGRLADTRRAGDEVLQVFPGYTDIVLEQALAARAQGDLDTAIAELERCLEMGDAPARYSPTVGAGTYLALLPLALLRRDRGELDETARLLRRCRAEHPGFGGSVEPLAAVLLAQGGEAADVVAELEGGAELTPGTRFLLAAALSEAGAAAAAEGQLRAVLGAQPGAEAARVALAETLLAQRRPLEAAEVAEAVSPDAPLAVAAARTALFGRLVAEEGDGAAIEALLRRAAGVGLAPAELRAFEGWNAVRAGGEPPATVPADAADAVLLMLEATLKMEAYDAYAALLPVAEALGLPWRERHERLARLYVRRGALESAAEEWISVMEQAPDAAALAGLAEVAALRGMHDDAQVFATEAQALEPGHPGAGRLLEALAA